ncbi:MULTISPECIES: transcriptional regulator [Pectobacterium]|uniref:transcriptional regulator n=1 Tax=Pectobacterium TaxID=122277 RepID=UPI0019697318|nr:YdaS family helix-turn-helix protein [Pectobacterium brasiliense]MBN3057957.1 helix-turn-helix domain-containing protein [Pectobacterium brasiliense]
MNIIIQKAIAMVGSQKELAEKVGVDQSAVSKWLRGGGIRSQYIPKISLATNGEISAEDILSSIGNSSSGSENPNETVA